MTIDYLIDRLNKKGRDATLQYKNKKNLYKIIFLTILLGFIISLVGCNWLAFGLLNIFDPQAQIRTDFNPEDAGDPCEGCFNLSAYSINEVEFFITGFSYDYHGDDYNSGGIDIPELSRDINVSFYVKPSSSPGTPGDKTIIENIPLYVQDVTDYVTLNPFIIEVNCDIDLIGVDGAGHNQTIPIVSSLPVLQPGVDVTPPVAVIKTSPEDPSGDPPLTVAFDASTSTDDRGIASYDWNFGDGTTGTEVAITHTYENAGTFIVTLTVTDLFGNEGIDIKIITVGIGEVGAVIVTTPSPAEGFTPFTVGFDASGSTVEVPPITSYEWDFNADGVTDATGVTAVHTFSSAGTYLVQLTVTDDDANEYVAFVTVIATSISP
jgi:PKD repeat protein